MLSQTHVYPAPAEPTRNSPNRPLRARPRAETNPLGQVETVCCSTITIGVDVKQAQYSQYNAKIKRQGPVLRATLVRVPLASGCVHAAGVTSAVPSFTVG